VINLKKTAVILIIIISFQLIVSSLPVYSITPQIQQKEAEADEIGQQLQELGQKQEAAVERYNKANEELAQTEEKLRINQRKLDDAKVDLEESQKVLGGRIRRIYEQKESSFFDVLFSTTSFNQLVSTLDFFSMIAQSDASVINQVKAARSKLSAAREKLEVAEEKQLVVTNELADQKAEIEEKQNQKQALLNKVQGQIEYLREKEEAEIRRLREEALAKLEQSKQNNQDYQGLPTTNSNVIAFAQQYLGTPYVWGGEDPSGFDCSGFAQYVYANFNVYLPRVANDQMNYLYSKGRGVDKGSLQPGDLVFYGNSGYSTHVVIYMGEGYVIGASGGQYTPGEVKIANIDYRSDYCGSGRP